MMNKHSSTRKNHIPDASERAEMLNSKPATPKGKSMNNSKIPNVHIDENGNEVYVDENGEMLEDTSQEFFASNAKRLSDYITDADIPSLVTKASEVEGVNLVLRNVTFKNSFYQGEQVENAWFDAYDPANPQEDLRVVCAGYYVIAQMKLAQSRNLFPVQGSFVRNPSKRNRWEFK